MKKISLFLIIVSIFICASCTKKEEEEIFDPYSVDVTEYSVRERREAFLEVVWGEVPENGHFTSTPWENITFERTVARSFDDIFFFTLVIFEHHPYLINPDNAMEVYTAPETTFNLLNLPGQFDYLQRSKTEDGTHIVTGFHNGIPFEIEFKEETQSD